MDRIDSIDKIKEMAKRVFRDKTLTHLIYEDGKNRRIEILRDGKRIYEFICSTDLSQQFLDDAIDF
jgi:hypothetical protein